MRALLKKILEILDGTPAAYGKKRRGQSVVELALVSPLLVILLAGMVEVGWFARNYLILLEVTRVGARAGTVQQNEMAPLAWDDVGSLINNNPAVDPSGKDPSKMTFEQWKAKYRYCNANPGSPAKFGFYNFIACVMLRSLDPLEFHTGTDADGKPYPDDIVISAFAVQAIDPAEIPNKSIESDITWPLEREGVASGDTYPQAIVVGRWPDNANECDYDSGGKQIAGGVDGRDPFDWITDDARTLNPASSGVPVADRTDRDYLELAGMDSTPEKQRGFVWLGQHKITGTSCIGSEWSLSEVEDLVNVNQFNMIRDGKRQYVPSQGIVLVEMWWQHQSISQFVGLAPVISPVFAMLGTDTTISVWAAFPLPQVEPRIAF